MRPPPPDPTPLRSQALDLPLVRHGFLTRCGGVSQGEFASLNCGRGGGDEGEAVRENRLRALRLFAGDEGAGAWRLCLVRQVHGTHVVRVDAGDASGDGAPLEGDALVCGEGGIALGVLTADCCPVLFADAEARVVAAAHAGWRGALNGVLEATLEAMLALGARREGVRVALGPAIGVASYEVGEEFRELHLRQDPEASAFFSAEEAGGQPHFDLAAYIGHRLKRSGITQPIAAPPAETYGERERFFSARRAQAEGAAHCGRQISLIGLRHG